MTDSKPTVKELPPGWIRSSVSAIGTFKECNYKWYLSYRTDTPRVQGNVKARYIGSSVHKALELYYSLETDKELKESWVSEPFTIVPYSIEAMLTEEQEKAKEVDGEKPVVAWEYSIQEEAVIYSCFLSLRDAIDELDLEIIATEFKVRIDEWFTGIIDVVAKVRGTNTFVIVDYKNQAKADDLDSNIRDEQLRIYEAVADQLTDKEGNKLVTGPLLGVAKLIAVKPTNKFRCAGHSEESFEQYNKRCSKKVQFVFVNADKSISDEVKELHMQANKDINGRKNPNEFPRNRKNCIGKYGPCEFFQVCNPPSNRNAGIALMGPEIKMGSKILRKMAAELPVAEESVVETETIVDMFDAF